MMKKTGNISGKVLKAVEKLARNEVEKSMHGKASACAAIYHQPKRPKRNLK